MTHFSLSHARVMLINLPFTCMHHVTVCVSIEFGWQVGFIHSVPLSFNRLFIGLEVRLFGMNTPNVGQVQAKYNGTWGAICAVIQDFTYQSAEVTCRQLNQGPPLKDRFISDKCPRSIQGAKMVWLAQINCQGFEVSLNQCTLKVLGGFEGTDCRACKWCTVCLSCQSLHPNITGISKSLFTFTSFVIVNGKAIQLSPAMSDYLGNEK